MKGSIKLTPSEQFEKFLAVVQTTANILGVNVISPAYRMNWATALILCLIVSYISFTLYTLYIGVIAMQSFTLVLQSLCITAVGTQVVNKFVNAVTYPKLIRFVCDELRNIYKEYECNINKRYSETLKDTLAVVKKSIWILFIINNILMASVLAVPFYYSIVRNEHIDMIQLVVPGVDKNGTGYSPLSVAETALDYVVCVRI
ncbi:uncharacterized protein LOC133324793 [Musca vetustissima]|uniref:uncharacterized protein LOC133324793 n=1 Tax=Musca vetustissima TaxID=27455 RepID=UPI002AB6030D|nr:uncharacterized protein LOC133324793 [Musca vetustissima]